MTFRRTCGVLASSDEKGTRTLMVIRLYSHPSCFDISLSARDSLILPVEDVTRRGSSPAIQRQGSKPLLSLMNEVDDKAVLLELRISIRMS